MAVLDIVVKVSGDGSVEIEKIKRSAQSTEKETNKLKDTNKKLGNSYKDLKTDIKGVIGTIAGIYALAKGFQALAMATKTVLVDGFEFSKQMEEAKAGLSALSLAIQDKNIPVMERMAKANLEATASLEALKKINASTPHTLDQTNQIYKAMYVSMKNVGASSQEIIDLTQRLSVASGSAGIEFNSLLAGVDGLATGTVLANSDLGRFLGSLGLTNEELKNSNDVMKLVSTTLEDFKAIDTITTATSNLSNEWGQLSSVMTENIFDGSKVGLNSLSDVIKGLTDEDIEDIKNAMNGMAIVALETANSMVQGFIIAKDAIEIAGTAIADVILWLTEWDGDYDAMSKNLWANTNKNLEVSEKLSKSIEEAKNKTREAIRTSQTRVKTVLNEAEAYEILNEKIDKNSDHVGQATIAEMEKIYADELQAMGLNALGDELEGVNGILSENVDAYDSARDSANEYSDAVDRLNNTRLGSSPSQSTYSTTTTLKTPQDYADYGWSLPDDYYTNPDYNPYAGFASGGYTGDMGVNDIAGVVHGQEYVVDAKTTKDLGLNGSSGIFSAMSSKLDALSSLYSIDKTLKQLFMIQKNTYALLGEA